MRRIDHFNCLAADIKANREFFETTLGFRLTEQIVLDDGTEAGMWLTCTNKSYDFAYTREAHGVRGRFHHVTYALDSREAILQAADVFLENGVFIETGPHKHAVQQTFFLYVYEPGGNRVEVANAGARLVLAPDWKPIIWTEAERKKGQAWGLQDDREFPHPRHAAAAARRQRGNKQQQTDGHAKGLHRDNTGKTALVVSAHSADFVWRAGGAIALHAAARRGRHRDLPVLWRARRIRQTLAPAGHDAGAGEGRAAEGSRGGGQASRRRRHPVLGSRRLPDHAGPGVAVPAGRRVSRHPSGLRALAFASATSTTTTTRR